ncbi:MAG TPA: hydantoinase B/oxoprolinase family protein [Pyrinomonadaceae bacterium]
MGRTKFDPVTLEIYRALYTSVAEEMGVSLRRTAFSPNIKERRDYSCAVFDSAGRVVAQGDHMPVHLGSMPMAVAAALAATEIGPGDVVALNDPFAGGTHLPDVTLVAGVFAAGAEGKGERGRGSVRSHRSDSRAGENGSGTARAGRSPLFFVANRAHHADIGGGSPGSMGMAVDVYGEGLRIPPVKIVRAGSADESLMRVLLANVRGAGERRADFEAQIGSLKTGASRLLEIVERSGAREAAVYAGHLIEYSSRMMRAVVRGIPDGVYEAEDWLDGDGVKAETLRLRARVTVRGARARVDFAGSAPQVQGPLNAVEAITVSAVSYVFRCLLGADEVPASAGLMEPIEVVAPAGTIVNALPPAAVAGGNVETSQRIVDVLFRALARAVPEKIPAASQGTMNNLTVGGVDQDGREFAYYETVAGGMGARPGRDGMSAVHTHMTNSLNTPAEALEYAYPLRVRRYAVRRNSGGRGGTRGGDGIIREIETLAPARASLLADRRATRPYGLAGGDEGRAGRDSILRREGGVERIEAKGSWDLRPGDRVRIETPGGGGHGKAKAKGKGKGGTGEG